MADNEKEPETWKGLAARYLAQQGPTTVLLFLIFGVICWAGHYALTHAIPDHLDTIQAGYKQQSDMFRETLQEDRAERKEQFKDMKASFDRATETFEEAVDAFEKKNIER